MSSHKFLIRLAALLGLTFLVGCGVSTVTIEGSFPTPNISKLPLNVAVYYDQSSSGLRLHGVLGNRSRGI